MTVKSDLDLIQSRLQDSGVIWPRSELLIWYNDAYRNLLSKSASVSRFDILDVPGRFSYTFCYEWEDRYTTGRIDRAGFSSFDSMRTSTYLWESQHLDGTIPVNSQPGTSQIWEIAYIGTTDRHYRFALSKSHEHIKKISWDDQLILPVAVRELDWSDRIWFRAPGEPRWWTPGVGRQRTFEIYEIRTDYQQGYVLNSFDSGLARRITSDASRSYATSVDKNAPFNSYAYTNSGESQALTGRDMNFVPVSCFTSEADRSFSPTPSYNFTINFTMNISGLQYTYTQPWEYGSSTAGSSRGMWPWERIDTSGQWSNDVITADNRPPISGMGYLITAKAGDAASSFCTQSWELDQLNGLANMSVGAILGGFYWEADFGTPLLTFAVGTIRSIISPDRQYLPVMFATSPKFVSGLIRDWKSSVKSMLVIENAIPDEPLVESDTPDMIPSQLSKYLRYYVLYFALGRQGEGQRTDLSQHYLMRYQRGIAVMKRLGLVTERDRVYVREETTEVVVRPPRVRLPVHYPVLY